MRHRLAFRAERKKNDYNTTTNIPVRTGRLCIRLHASGYVRTCFHSQAPESYDLWQASEIVETCLVAKFDRLPPGVADALKKNPTFIEEEGPMREAVLAASPLTKQELLRNSPGAEDIAVKVGCGCGGR